MFNEDLMKWFASAFEFSDHDINQLILLSKKSIYPYEDMNNDWEKLDEAPLPEKKHFYGNLNMKPLLVETTDTQKQFGKSFKL